MCLIKSITTRLSTVSNKSLTDVSVGHQFGRGQMAPTSRQNDMISTVLMTLKNVLKVIPTSARLLLYRYSSSWEPHLRDTGRDVNCHMGSHSVTCERAPPNPSHAGWYSIYLPRSDGKLSWPSWLDSAPAGSRTSDLSITSSTPNRCNLQSALCTRRSLYKRRFSVEFN